MILSSIPDSLFGNNTFLKRKSSRHHSYSIYERMSQTIYPILFTTIGLNFLPNLPITGVDALSDQTKYLIGVQPDRRNFYELNSGQSFRCLDGSGSIPMEFVNDDYCDCTDGSDEPGTSACPQGRFFCSNLGYIQKLIPAAWVNDGQCDCCDASDEYNSSTVCENTCGILGELYRQRQEEHQQIADRGSAIRSQYKEEARQRKEQNTQLLEQYKRELSEKENAIKKLEEELNSDFGPSNVFLPLKGKCFSYNDREYTYTLCPFERATQESTSGMQTELGRWAGWAGPAENLYVKQRYEGGIQCWNGPTRSALVNIDCGVEDKITSVTEPSKCEYVYNFITPAACPDTDPPETPVPESEPTQTMVPEASNPATSLEIEDDPESSNYFPDETNEAPDGDSAQDIERHDEL